MVRFKVMA